MMFWWILLIAGMTKGENLVEFDVTETRYATTILCKVKLDVN